MTAISTATLLACPGMRATGVSVLTAAQWPLLGVIVLLAVGLVWQVLRLRIHSHHLRERQERVRGLESLLHITARIHAFRDRDSLLTEIAESVRKSLGFRMVLLRIYDPQEKVFEAQAFAGVDEEGQEYLRNMPLSLGQFRRMTLPQFKVSNSYYIRYGTSGYEEAAANAYETNLGRRDVGGDEWDERDMLIVPLISPEGEITGYLSVDDPVNGKVPSRNTIEMLELFAQQAATAIASAALYSQLHKQNRELKAAADRLRYHNDLKNNFVANVSHELRTPLTAIKAYTEALLHGRQRMADSAVQEFLEVIHGESEKLSGIVNNLLDLERMENEQITFNRHETDLVALVRGLEGSARSQAEAKKIDFSIHCDQSEIRVDVDPDLVRQLIRHLLDNAFKFTPEGGKVHLALFDGLSSVRIVVEDTGIGVPESKMAYVFDRFYQVDGSSTREHGGQGVGLAICRDIVARHGGRIWGESLHPRGSRFQALLPRRSHVVRQGQGHPQRTVFAEMPEFSEKMIRWIGEMTQAGIVALEMPDAQGEHLLIEAAMGLQDRVVQQSRLLRGEGIPGHVWATGRPVHVRNLADDPEWSAEKARCGVGEGSLLCVPVRRDGDVVGVLLVAHPLDGRSFNKRDLLLLEGVADRLGYIIERVEAHTRTDRDVRELLKAMRRGLAVHRARHDVLADISHDICIEAAQRLHLPRAELAALAFALQAYDLGLSEVPDEILYKATPLLPEEWEIIQQHVHRSLEMIRALEAPPTVGEIILHHHEHYDGSGYPDGLAGEDIPVGSRLLALADGLTAMLHGRPYRPAVSLERALAEMEQLAGSQFCPRCLVPFSAAARRYAERIREIQLARSLAVADYEQEAGGAGHATPDGTSDAEREPVLAGE